MIYQDVPYFLKIPTVFIDHSLLANGKRTRKTKNAQWKLQKKYLKIEAYMKVD